ncbi:MAG TPA: DMT family transporter [Thermoplasmata archaeon]|nr:DMT family transporter [Thermoplasmata archaeon]
MATEAWLGLALATVLVWGCGTLVSKPATMRLGTRRMLAFIAVFEGGAYVALFSLLRTPLNGSDPYGIVAGFLAALTGTLGYIFYYEGILVGSVGLMGTVTAAYPVPTILLSLWLLGESLNAAQAAGIVLVLLCVVVLSREPTRARTGKTSAVVFALLAFVSWGIWGYFAKVAVDRIGEGNVFGFYALSNALVLGSFILLTRKRPLEAPHADRGHATAFGLLDVTFGAGGVVVLTYAYALGPASLVSAVTGSYPLVSTLAAHFFLKERFGWKEAAALLLFIPGVLLIAL